MDIIVGSFAIPGATLAQILHDFGSVEGDCDGILFGRLQQQTKSRMQDDEAGPQIPHEEVTARVTGYYCTGRVQSFYDSTGRLNHSKLANIVRDRQGRGEDPLIGWYLGRRSTSMWPSMREAAVTSYLRSGFITPAKLEEDDSTHLISPDLKSLQIGSLQGEDTSAVVGVTQRRQPLQTVDSPTGRGVLAKPLVSSPGLDSPSSPSKIGSPSTRRSSASCPGQDKGVGPVPRAPLPLCFFVLFTESDSVNNAVRTHEYRAFQSLQAHPRGISFEPLPVNIVNAGVSFRGFYDSFVPVATIPSWFSHMMNSERITGNDLLASPTSAQKVEGNSGKSSCLENNGRSSSKTYQDVSQSNLQSGYGEDTIHARGLRVTQFESLYQEMLTRLENLSKEAYESSVAQYQVSRPT